MIQAFCGRASLLRGNAEVSEVLICWLAGEIYDAIPAEGPVTAEASP